MECFNRNIKYEDLYRDLPIDGVDLTDRVSIYRDLYNTIRKASTRPPPRPRHRPAHYTANAPTRGSLDADHTLATYQ